MRLNKPKNLHMIKGRRCSNCGHGVLLKMVFICERPEGPVWAEGEGKHTAHVCDGYDTMDSTNQEEVIQRCQMRIYKQMREERTQE